MLLHYKKSCEFSRYYTLTLKAIVITIGNEDGFNPLHLNMDSSRVSTPIPTPLERTSREYTCSSSQTIFLTKRQLVRKPRWTEIGRADRCSQVSLWTKTSCYCWTFFDFHRHSQAASESIADYLAKLCRLSKHCDFKSFLEQALRDRFICRLRSEVIQHRLSADVNLMRGHVFKIAQGM